MFSVEVLPWFMTKKYEIYLRQIDSASLQKNWLSSGGQPPLRTSSELPPWPATANHQLSGSSKVLPVLHQTSSHFPNSDATKQQMAKDDPHKYNQALSPYASKPNQYPGLPKKLVQSYLQGDAIQVQIEHHRYSSNFTNNHHRVFVTTVGLPSFRIFSGYWD